MNKTDVLFIGTMKQMDGSDSLRKGLNQCGIRLGKFDFTSSVQSRLITELIESVSYLSDRFVARFLYSFEEEKQKLEQLIWQGVSYIVMTGLYFSNIMQFREIINFARSRDQRIKFIIGGGFLVSVLSKLSELEKQYFFGYINADFYINRFQCLGDVEEILSTNGYSPAGSDIYYKKGERFIRADSASHEPAILNNKIFWMDYKDYIRPVTALKTTVSCPYACSFCMVKQRTERFEHRDIRLIEQDLCALSRLKKTQLINFTDETINVPRSAFKQFLQVMIDGRFGFQWFSFFRTDQVDDEIAEMMKASGCIAVLLGMESGNDRMLQRMNKQTNTAEMARAHEIIRRHGIYTIGFFIGGYPGETDKTLEDTVNFINHVKPTFYKIHSWECDMGTRVWRERKNYGLELKNGVWSHKTMSLASARTKIDAAKQRIKHSCNIDGADFAYALQLLAAGVSMEQVKQVYHVAKVVNEQWNK